MSGVMRPVGPEQPQVYWVRRAIVVAAVLLALVLVIAVVANLNSPASASGPDAAPPPAAATSSTPATADSASTDPNASTDPSASAGSGDSLGPGDTPGGSPTAGPSVSLFASSGATPTAPTSRNASAEPTASTSPTGKLSAKSAPSASASPSASGSSAAIAACDPAQLRQTLTGKQSLAAKTKTEFDLSLINRSAAACQLRMTTDNFVLTIYSGRDRIWSTADCAALVKPTTVKVAVGDAYRWRIVWNGLRSKQSCKSRPEIPRPGTYVASAQFTGATPVRLRMVLHG